jgi:ssDNA-binding Zn-finger/Zn-ribbon topoisomerase 1
MKKKISLHVKCPHCRKSLMDEEVKLHDHPSIKLNIVTPDERGVIYLCSIFECYDHETDITMKKGTVVDVYCPKCNKEMLINEECNVCGAPMVSFVLRVGGRVAICSRYGCANHYVAFQDLSSELSKFYHEYEP